MGKLTDRTDSVAVEGFLKEPFVIFRSLFLDLVKEGLHEFLIFLCAETQQE